MAEVELTIILQNLVMIIYSSFVINNCTFIGNSGGSGGFKHIYIV